jgi:hypothetical protein
VAEHVTQPSWHRKNFGGTQATTMHCNSSANITVGKHLISNAFPIFIGCFARSLRPFLDPTANYGRASASLSFSWREILYRGHQKLRGVDPTLQKLQPPP